MSYGMGEELERLETAMEAAGVAWWWMDLPMGVVFFSPIKAELLGRKPDEFVHYKDFTKFVHTDDYERMMQDMTDHLEGRAEIYETTYRIRAKDGSYKKFYDRGRIVARKDGVISLAGLVFDVTEFDFTKKSKSNKRG